MARKPEQKLWDNLRANLGTNFWLIRFENSVSNGMPDIVGMHDGDTFWIELKYAVVPKLERTRLMGSGGMRTEQKNWHMLCHRFGGKSYVLIKTDKGDILFIEGHLALSINELSLTELREISLASTIKGVFYYLENN